MRARRDGRRRGAHARGRRRHLVECGARGVDGPCGGVSPAAGAKALVVKARLADARARRASGAERGGVEGARSNSMERGLVRLEGSGLARGMIGGGLLRRRIVGRMILLCAGSAEK